MGIVAAARRAWAIRSAAVLSAALAVACGGRSVLIDGAGGGSDSNGGATTQGGAVAQGGSAPQGGASTAGGGRTQGGAAGCGPVACPNLSCADGVLVPVAGSCCPVCEPPMNACTEGQMAYGSFRNRALEKFQSLACDREDDCTAVQVTSRCGGDCGWIAVVSTEAMELESVLNAEAAVDCASCIAPPATCNGSMPKVACIGRICSTALN